MRRHSPGGSWVCRLAAASVLWSLLVSPASAEMAPDPLEALREHYYAAVQERSAIAQGLEEIEALRAAGAGSAGGRLDAVLRAYQGALITLRAKHGFWPHDRLRYLRQGLTIMDAAVESHPDVAEVRYLRLMSCYYLPGILGRGASVRQDFAALARLLPTAREGYPPPLYRAIVEFVVENGDVTEEERAALLASLAPVRE